MLFIDRTTAVYFDSLKIRYIPLEILIKIKDKSVTQKIFRIQDNEYIICGLCFAAFIEIMLILICFLGMTKKEWQNNI